ncbi:MAG: YiiX/YebB-like N1pC/P60 family cysteine hydrolase [Dysgonomonas sp.]
MKSEKQIHIWIIYLCGLFISCEQPNTESSRIFPENILQEGDLAFREGDGLASRIILNIDKNSSYSHIGIVVWHNEKWRIIHAVPGEPDFEGDKDRVKIEDIQTYFSKNRAISAAIMRTKNDSIAKVAAHKAFNLYQRNILFDHSYNLEDTTKMYCTELIHHIFKTIGMDLTQGRRSTINSFGSSTLYILPSDIQKSTELKLIYNF